MDENEVINILCEYLREQGWEILQAITAGARGIDVIAIRNDGLRFLIEAKGGTSSTIGSSRYGKAYTKSQVFDVTSKGLMQCFQNSVRRKENDLIGFACPSGKYFDDYILPIKELIGSLGITIFMVSTGKNVIEL